MVLSGTWSSGKDALGSEMGMIETWGSGEDVPGTGMEMSGMRDTHLDEEAVLQRRDILAVAADLRRSRSGASCVIPFPPRTPTSARHWQARTPSLPQQDPRHANTLPGMQPQRGCGTKRGVKPHRTPQPSLPTSTQGCWGQGAGDKAPQGLPPPPQGSPTTPQQGIPQGIREGKGEESKPQGGEAPTRMLKGATPAWVLGGG